MATTPHSPFDVASTRTLIAPEIRRRIRAATGSNVDPERMKALEAVYLGTVLTASMGYSLHSGTCSVEHVATRIIYR
jgi:hypothetical protein